MTSASYFKIILDYIRIIDIFRIMRTHAKRARAQYLHMLSYYIVIKERFTIVNYHYALGAI